MTHVSEGLPSYLVSVIPDCDTNTFRNRLACSNDILVVLLLLRQQDIGHWKSHADVEFGDGNFDPKIGKLLDVGLDGCRDLSNDHVALNTDTVDGDTLRYEALDQVDHGRRFGTGTINIVVVDLFRSVSDALSEEWNLHT